jgi:hypothetical protein
MNSKKIQKKGGVHKSGKYGHELLKNNTKYNNV